MAESEEPSVGFWVLGGDSLRDALVRAAAGDDVDVILLELYANSDVKTVGGDD